LAVHSSANRAAVLLSTYHHHTSGAECTIYIHDIYIYIYIYINTYGARYLKFCYDTPSDAPVVTFGRFNPLAVVESTDVTVTCTATSNPPVDVSTIRWYRSGSLKGRTCYIAKLVVVYIGFYDTSIFAALITQCFMRDIALHRHTGAGDDVKQTLAWRRKWRSPHTCFSLRPSEHDNGYSHRFRSTKTNRPKFTSPGLPWWSPIQVLTKILGPFFNFSYSNVANVNNSGRQPSVFWRNLVT